MTAVNRNKLPISGLRTSTKGPGCCCSRSSVNPTIFLYSTEMWEKVSLTYLTTSTASRQRGTPPPFLPTVVAAPNLQFVAIGYNSHRKMDHNYSVCLIFFKKVNSKVRPTKLFQLYLAARFRTRSDLQPVTLGSEQFPSYRSHFYSLNEPCMKSNKVF